jgi:hypothetical protein
MTRRDRLVALASSGRPPLLAVLARISDHPHTAVVVDRPLASVADVRQVDTEAIGDALQQAEAVVPAPARGADLEFQGETFRFAQLYDTVARTTHDTAPNRFLRQFALRWRKALRAEGGDDPEIVAIVARLDRLLGALRDLSPIRSTSTGDPVLQHDPMYRRILAASLELSRILREEPVA